MHAVAKLWLMNTTHLAVATYADAASIELLSDALYTETIRQKVQELQRELIAALVQLARDIGLPAGVLEPEFVQKASDSVDRIRGNQKDESNRILKDLSGIEAAEARILRVRERTAALREGGDVAECCDALEKELADLVRGMDLSAFMGKVVERVIEPYELLREHEHEAFASSDLLAAVWRTVDRKYQNYSKNALASK